MYPSQTIPKKSEEEGKFLNSFYKTSIALIPKAGKDSQRGVGGENCRPVSVVNIDEESSTKY